MNEIEAEFLCGCPVTPGEGAAQAAMTLRALGPQTVIITLGKDGAYVATGHQTRHLPAFEVTAVDTTAAGDVFCGVLAAAIVEGLPLFDAARFANAAAAIAVTRLGAQPSIPVRQEVQEFLASRDR